MAKIKLTREQLAHLVQATSRFLNEVETHGLPANECAKHVLDDWMRKKGQSLFLEKAEYPIKLNKAEAAALEWAFGFGENADIRIYSMVQVILNSNKKMLA